MQKLFSTCANWCAGDFSAHTTRCLVAKRRGPRMTPAGCFACVVRQADGAMCAPVDARSQAFRYGKVTLCSWRLKKYMCLNFQTVRAGKCLFIPKEAPTASVVKYGSGMVASRHSPLVFRQPWSIFWRFSTLLHKEHGLAHVLVRGLIIRTVRARSRRHARPQCRLVSGCGRSRGAGRAV